MSKCTQDNQDVAGKKHQKFLRKNMSMFVKGRWFPLIITLIVLAVFVLVMALFGWRITYAPGLENSWDAISAVAAWAGAIGTVVAVFSAIYVAHRQNEIALFEKRYTAYMKFNKLYGFARSLDKQMFEDEDTLHDAEFVLDISAKIAFFCIGIQTQFGFQPMTKEEGFNLEGVSQVSAILQQYQNDIVMLSYLYDLEFNDQLIMERELENIFACLSKFMTQVTLYTFEENSKYDDSARKMFISGINDFHKKYWMLFEKSLRL